MSKSVCLAAFAAATVLSATAEAQPRPRFSTRLPAAQPTAPPVMTPYAGPAAPAPSTAVEAAVQAETPRAAPLGSVLASDLPTITAAPTLETPAAPQLTPAEQAPTPATPPTQPAPASTLHHVVASGDTIYAVGRRYGVGPQAVAELNGLSFGSTLRVGQRLALPAGAADKGAEAAFPAGRRSAALTPPSEAPVQTAPPPIAPPAAQSPPPPAAVVTPSPAAAPTPVPAVAPAPRAVPADPVAPPPPQQPAAPPRAASPVLRPAPPAVAPTAAVQAMAWPLRGDILQPFGPTGVGQRNDGLRIAAPEGAPVRAAAAGRVVYAGDQIKGGYGKLVLVEHEERWFTAYAHLGEIRVRMQERVIAGQELGSVGRTGSVSAPQLYFEVRHAPRAGERARPVDPLPLLPQP